MTKKFFSIFSIIVMLSNSLFISYFSYIDYISLQKLISNSLISDNSVSIILETDSHIILKDLTTLIDKHNDITIFTELYNNDDLTVWGIYGDCKFKSNVYSMIEGEFFDKSTFNNKINTAVIGKNILDTNNYFLNNNKEGYFKFGNINYKIIGIISSNISNMLDNTTYINLSSENIKNIHKLIIDGHDLNGINNFVKEIESKYKIYKINENKNFMSRYIFNYTDIKLLNLFIIIFMILIFIVLLIYTIYSFNEEIKIKWLIGLNYYRNYLSLFIKILTLYTFNTIIFLIMYKTVYFKILSKIFLNFFSTHLIVFNLASITLLSISVFLYMHVSNKFFYKYGVK